MATRTIRASARVQVTVEIPVQGCWGHDAPMEQVYKQAKESALGYLNNALRAQSVQLIGEPVVKMVIVEEER